MVEESKEKSGILGWFATNHVAANLLMLLIVVSGFLTIMTVKREVFPETSLDMISIIVPYRGASPEDVEKGVCLRVEEAIVAVEGVKRINSTASEGRGTITVEVEEYTDITEVLDDIKAQIDRITTFPVEAEKAVISEIKTHHPVITVVVYGDVDEKTLRVLADRIRDDLTVKDNISQVSIYGVRPYEISIEVPEENLRRYGLSFDDITRAVRESSLDIPAGSIKTKGGEVLVRTEGQKYYGPEFEQIIVLTRNDGTIVRLSDIAVVKDEFEESDLYTKFDGKRAALVKVSRIGEQDALGVTKTVKEYIKQKEGMLPGGISLGLWEDDSLILKSRMNLLLRNGCFGLILVFLCLMVFLDLKLAFWITMGIPISFLGAFWLMPMFGLSINMMSLFALIMALGLVVDDAIVVGENIFTYIESGMDLTKAAIKGAKEMAMPVVLSVLTTVFAFLPLAHTTGILGKILRVLPIVMVAVLSFSLVESLLILPAHLCSKISIRKNLITSLIDKVRIRVDKKLADFVNGRFANFVERAVKWRYVTLGASIFILILAMGYVQGGYIQFVFFDAVEADNMIAFLTMPQGTSVEQTQELVKKLESAALETIAEFDEKRQGASLMKHISSTIGTHPTLQRHGPESTSLDTGASANLAEVNVELLGGQERDVSSVVLKNRWRDKVGEIPGVSSLTFMSEIFSVGEDINVELSHQRFEVLVDASEKLKDIIREYAGVKDIQDSFEEGKPELKLSLKDTGRMLGLTLSALARQVRQGFYGEEAQRIQRGRDDIRVMVRYPEQERKSLADIENMRIRLPDGTEIPFKTVAAVKYGTGYAEIKRVDRRRVVNVLADVDESVANADDVNRDLQANVLPQLMREYAGLQYRFAGAERERSESLGSLRISFAIALMAIYGILAVQFRSYTQPVIVMMAIPFGLVGALIGHILLGFNLSILSLFGVVALAGVVVNDSLILIDLINRERKEGASLSQIVRDCATRRFRPIMLTTLTTFFGLAPMMMERSLQARFLIPMAISLAFGVMFATMITLFIVPSIYMILEDIKARFARRSVA